MNDLVNNLLQVLFRLCFHMKDFTRLIRLLSFVAGINELLKSNLLKRSILL